MHSSNPALYKTQKFVDCTGCKISRNTFDDLNLYVNSSENCNCNCCSWLVCILRSTGNCKAQSRPTNHSSILIECRKRSNWQLSMLCNRCVWCAYGVQHVCEYTVCVSSVFFTAFCAVENISRLQMSPCDGNHNNGNSNSILQLWCFWILTRTIANQRVIWQHFLV